MKLLNLFVASAAALAALPALANPELAKAKNCLACHSVANKIVGPAFKDVAARYTNNSDAVKQLATTIQKGSAAKWGPIAMPPNAVSDQEATALAKWVLAQK